MTTAQQSHPLSTEQIVALEIPPILRVQHLNRDVTIGLVGDKGAGKSIGGGLISLFDYGLQGDPIFANTRLKATIEADADMLEKYGMEPKEIVYEAVPLDKRKFLHFSPEYRNGVFFTHEFNIWLADARRSSSNLNLETDDVAQQLRKLKSAWIYDCIDEGFVDFRVRDATDIFIRTKDTALSHMGMSKRQPQGVEFEWWLYAMTDKGAAILDTEVFNSKTYQHAVGPIYVKGKQFWGLIDTEKREKRERYKSGGISYDVEIEDGPELAEARDEWEWLQDKLVELKAKGTERIRNYDLWDYLQLKDRDLHYTIVGRILSERFNIKSRRLNGGTYYLFDTFKLDEGMKTKTAVMMK